MDFKELYKIDVSEYTEKKGKFNYVSWVYAVKTLRENDPKATWTNDKHEVYPDGSVMVYSTVNAFDVELTAFLPVTDYYNKAIKNPDAYAINTAKQRCLVKAIALHGIGLYIYAGEDLPEEPKAEKQKEEKPKKQPLTGEEYLMLLNGIKDAKTHAEFNAAREKVTEIFKIKTRTKQQLDELEKAKKKKFEELCPPQARVDSLVNAPIEGMAQ